VDDLVGSVGVPGGVVREDVVERGDAVEHRQPQARRVDRQRRVGGHPALVLAGDRPGAGAVGAVAGDGARDVAPVAVVVRVARFDVLPGGVALERVPVLVVVLHVAAVVRVEVRQPGVDDRDVGVVAGVLGGAGLDRLGAGHLAGVGVVELQLAVGLDAEHGLHGRDFLDLVAGRDRVADRQHREAVVALRQVEPVEPVDVLVRVEDDQDLLGAAIGVEVVGERRLDGRRARRRRERRRQSGRACRLYESPSVEPEIAHTTTERSHPKRVSDGRVQTSGLRRGSSGWVPLMVKRYGRSRQLSTVFE